jgi:DNA-binding transcriptional ArsR family regulator
MTNLNTATAALSALGDPMRRQIFDALATRPSPVGALAASLPVTRSAMSRRLRVLKEAGLVSETAEGTRRIYRIDPRGIGAIRDWLDQHWASALDAFAAYADPMEPPSTHEDRP